MMETLKNFFRGLMLEEMVWSQHQLALCSSLRKDRLHGKPLGAPALRVAELKMRESFGEDGSEKYLYHLHSQVLHRMLELVWIEKYCSFSQSLHLSRVVRQEMVEDVVKTDAISRSLPRSYWAYFRLPWKAKKECVWDNLFSCLSMQLPLSYRHLDHSAVREKLK